MKKYIQSKFEFEDIDGYDYLSNFYDWYDNLPENMRATVDDIADTEVPYYDECNEDQLLWLMEQVQAD